jgi:hypothetical protein
MIGKILVIAGAGLVLGLVAARAGLLEGPEALRARKALGEAFRRIPLPHLKLHLPTTAGELDGLDDALCECALSTGAASGMSEPQLLVLLASVQECTAFLLFPDIDWPPVHSDNPTIHQYWAILEQRYRRLVRSGELAQFCGLGSVPAPPSVTSVEPTRVLVGTKPLVHLAGAFTPATTVDLSRGDGRRLNVELRAQTPDSLQLVVDADEPGSYDLVVSNGPNPASSVNYPGALVVAPKQQEE